MVHVLYNVQMPAKVGNEYFFIIKMRKYIVTKKTVVGILNDGNGWKITMHGSKQNSPAKTVIMDFHEFSEAAYDNEKEVCAECERLNEILRQKEKEQNADH